MEEHTSLKFRSKLFFVCNQLHFFELRSSILIFLYFSIQNLALMSTLDDVSKALGATNSIALKIFTYINNIFFFFTVPPFDGTRASDIFNLSLTIVITSFLLIYMYCLLSLNLDPKIRKTNKNQNYLIVIKIISFNFIYGNILYGTFCIYYTMKLISSAYPYVIVIPLINLAFILFINYSFEQFSNQNNYNDIRGLSLFYHQGYSKLAMFKLIFKICISSLGLLMNAYVILATTQFMFFFLDLIDFRYIIFRKKYLDTYTQNMKNLWLMFEISIQLCNIGGLVFSLGIIINNFTSIIPTLTCLGFYSVKKYRDYHQNRLLLCNITQIENEGDANLLMFEYFSLLNPRNQQRQILFQGLIRFHINYCTKCNCFCKHFDTIATYSMKTDFILKFVLMKLQQVLQKFQSSFIVINIYLNFRISFLHSFTKSSTEIVKYKKRMRKQLTKGQLFLVYQLQQNVKVGMEEVNRELINTEFDEVFKEDVLHHKLQSDLLKLNNLNTTKLIKIQSDLFSLNQIETICSQITELIRIIQSMWLFFKAKQSSNIKIYQTFLIYFEYIIHSKSTVAEIRSIVLRKMAIMHHLKGADKNNIKYYVYTDRACIIETYLQLQGLSPITNVSKNCKQFFNASKELLKGKDVHHLMAQFLANPHREMITEWVEADRITGTLSGLTLAFFADRLNQCFRGQIVLKIQSLGLNLRFYGVLVKQNEDDYMLLDYQCKIQSLGHRLMTEHLFDRQHVNYKFDLFCSKNLEEMMRDRECVRKTMILNNSLPCDPSPIKYEDDSEQIGLVSFNNKESVRSSFLFESQITISKHHMGKALYYSLKFGQIRPILDIVNATVLPILNSNLPISLGDEQTIKELCVIETKNKVDIINEQDSQDISSINRAIDEKFQFALNTGSSEQSTKAGNSDIKISKILENMKMRAINYKSLWNQNLVVSSGIIVVLMIVIVWVFYIQITAFSSGMNSVSKLNTAALAITDNFQLFKISYNSLLMAKTYCFSSQVNDIQRCLMLQQTTFYTLSEVYSLVISQFFASDDYTTLGTKTYVAFETLITVKLGSNYETITIREFLEQYYYAMLQADNEIKANSTNISIEANNQFTYLFQNWVNIKYISLNTTEYYAAAANDELTSLQTYLYVYSVCFFISSLGLVLIIYFSRMKSFQKRQKYMSIYTLIPPTYSAYLKSFIAQVDECLKHNYNPLELLPPTDQNYRVNKFKFQLKPTRYTKTYLIIVLLALSAFNCGALIHMLDLISPAQQMASSINYLIESQNYSLQNYFQLKTYYLQYNFSKSIQEISSQILVHLNQTEIDFVTHVRTSIELFQPYDSTCKDDLMAILSKNVCVSVAQYNPSWLNQQCNNNNNDGILQKGLVAGWTFLQRSSMSALKDLSNNFNINREDYFSQQTYKSLDNFIYFMFKVYQEVEQRIVKGLSVSTSVKMNQLMQIWAWSIIGILTIIVTWGVICKLEKQSVGNLYGAILQLPHLWLAQNRLAKNILAEQLHLV